MVSITRGFGIDASVPVDVALTVAELAEDRGFGSFWVNGSPHGGALDIITGAIERSGLDVGVGVFPLTRISANELVDEIQARDLPQERLLLGVGSNRRPGALDEVRAAATTIRENLDVTVVTGAVGPKMLALAAEVADGVILTWSFVAEVNRARPILARSAAEHGRQPPQIISFIRCGLVPQAAEAIAERARVYSGIPHYQAVFERNGLTAEDTVVSGKNRTELLEGIERESAVVEIPVIRAIPAENTVASLGELLEACAP